jgi:hypothetical protein
MFEQIDKHKDRVNREHIMPATTWQTKAREPAGASV